MTTETWFKQRTPITEALSLIEVAKFLKILEIKFVSGTKLSRKESFVLTGLRLLPDFFSPSNPSHELFFTSELQKLPRNMQTFEKFLCFWVWIF